MVPASLWHEGAKNGQQEEEFSEFLLQGCLGAKEHEIFGAFVQLLLQNCETRQTAKNVEKKR